MKPVQENKIIVTIVVGFVMMFFTNVYSWRVNAFKDNTKEFVLKETYTVMSDNFKERLDRIESKIDALLKGGK